MEKEDIAGRQNKVTSLVVGRRRDESGPSGGLMGGEIDVQVATAKQFPRSIGEAKQRAIELATLDQETAAACIYAVPRGGKVIEGPSTRLAEIVAASWGNFRVRTKTTGEDESFIYAEAIAWDLQSNTAISCENRRRITKKDGQRYDDDMIATTANAAVSIALRNAIFHAIPRSYINEIYQAARKAAAGNVRTLKQQRAEMFGYFGRQGITEQQIFDLLSISKADDVTLDHLATLRGIATSIKDGVTSVSAIFAHDDTESAATHGKKKPVSVPAEQNNGQTSPATGTCVDTAEKKMLVQIQKALEDLHPGKGVKAQAERLKVLNYVFGKVQLDEIAKLPVQILEAGLSAIQSQAATNKAEAECPV